MTENNATIAWVDLDELVPRYPDREANPNKMSPERFDLLVEALKNPSVGFLQPILARYNDGGKLEIVDGHHRWWAARKAKLKRVSIVELAEDSANVAAGLAVGMNRLRGELDIGMAAEALQGIFDATNWTVDQVSVLTGFTAEEISVLVEQASQQSEDLADVGPEASASEEDDAPPKPFVLEITFAEKDQYTLCRRKLKKAAGKGGDLARGLLSVLGELEG